MIGVVFNVFEEFIIKNFDAEAYEDLLDTTELSDQGPHLGPGNYPDTDFLALFTNTLQRHNLEAPAALRMFGAFLFDALAERYAPVIEPYDNPKDLIKNIHDVIHVEVKKLYPDAVTPAFSYEELDDGRLNLVYKSERNLPDLAAGLIDGCSKRFGLPIEQERAEGEDGATVFTLSFGSA